MSTSRFLRRLWKHSSFLQSGHLVKRNGESIRRLCSSAITDTKTQVKGAVQSKHAPHSVSRTVEHDQSDVSAAFKKVMRRVPQPVVVVTTAEWDELEQAYLKRGITCSSFTSVSIEPAVVSVCIGRVGKLNDMHDLLLRTQHFAVHVLSKDQVNHSVRFATPLSNKMEDHFAGFPHHRGIQNLPILEDTTAVIMCKALEVHPIGDHFVWYGQVLGADSDDNHQHPLLYYSRSYRAVGDEMFMQAFEDTTFPFDQWTHEAHIRMAWNYIREHGQAVATPMIKSGIKKYNITNEHLICCSYRVAHGYSETVTEFYINIISHALKINGDHERSFHDFLTRNPHLLDRRLIFQYYTEDLIQLPESRERFIPPDKKPLPE